MFYQTGPRFQIGKQCPFSLFDRLYDNSWSYSISRMETAKKYIDSLKKFRMLVSWTITWENFKYSSLLTKISLLHVACRVLEYK